MNAPEILASLGIDDPDDALFTTCWKTSQATQPEAIGFLEPEAIRRSCDFAGLPAAAHSTLLKAACRIEASPDLRALAWHCQHVLYEVFEFPAWRNTRRWPDPIPTLGDLSGAFYLLIALDAIPRMLEVHRQLGIPEPISRAGCSHYPASLQRFSDRQDGRTGMRPAALYWLRNHVCGDLFRLGRLEFMVKPFGGRLVAWRHRRTRAVTALAAAGVAFDDAGVIAAEKESATWGALLDETDETVTGTPISPLGHAEPNPVTLSRSEWEPALRPGDPILEVHIPAGGDMTPQRCRASMQQALEFFPRYFPHKPFVGFACGSWILNPELDRIYRPDSNMVLWQRELYLYPLANHPDSRSGLHFVFGTDDVDPATAPRDTSLRRALLDHLSAGGRLLGGGMFLLLEDFTHFGTQVYRRHRLAGHGTPGSLQGSG